MFCKFCGTQMNDGDLFCPNCGRKQTASTTQTAQPQGTVQTQPQATQYVAKKSNAGVIGAVVGVVVVAAVLLGYMFVIKSQQKAKRVAETRQKTAEFLWAVGQNGLAEEVMKHGINAKNNSGETALMIAGLHNNSEIAKMLVQDGAYINAKKNDGGTALTLAAAYNYRDVTQLLINAKADINSKDKGGSTALMWAALNNSYDVAQLLINAKANINAKNNAGWTALMNAANKNSFDVARLLINAGADINAKQNGGWTALIIAAANNSYDVAQLLINAKADINTRDNNGYIALSYAKDAQMQQLLRNAGATY